MLLKKEATFQRQIPLFGFSQTSVPVGCFALVFCFFLHRWVTILVPQRSTRLKKNRITPWLQQVGHFLLSDTLGDGHSSQAMQKWWKKHLAAQIGNILKPWLSRIKGVMESHDSEHHKQGMQDIRTVESKQNELAMFALNYINATMSVWHLKIYRVICFVSEGSRTCRNNNHTRVKSWGCCHSS